MKVLVVVCLIASVSALPRSFLGSEKCTWGPAYWCKTYKQATECNAIEHCKTHVWKSNDICSECKTVAGQLHDYCKNNASAVMKLMKNLCAELEQYATECKTVVALYGETIINMVVQLTADSEKFCQGLELCPKTKQDVTHWIMKVFLKQLVSNPTIMNVKSLKEDYCEDCKLVIGEIKDVLMNKEIQSDIIAALESLCTELGAFGAECKNLVDQYGPLVFDLLAGYMDPGTICSDLGLCNSSKNIVPAVPLKLAAVPLKPAPVKTLLSAAPIPVLILAKEVKKAKPAKSPKASLQCTLCEFVMKELDGLLKDQETEDGIEQALDKVCSLLPPTIQSDCEDFVKEFSPEIIDFLVNELQPDKVCAALGLCNGKKNLIRVSLHKDVKVKDETCELCKLAVQYLENVLKTNATEEEIKKALEQLCSSLPPQLSTECNQIVQEYGDLIIKLILGDITPEEVCQALNLCTAVKKSYVKNKCYLGESYWCANYFNALKCEALEHCNFIA